MNNGRLHNMASLARWIRTIGDRVPMLVVMLAFLVAHLASEGQLHGLWLEAAVIGVVALAATVPLSFVWMHQPGETFIERRAREGRAQRERLACYANSAEEDHRESH